MVVRPATTVALVFEIEILELRIFQLVTQVGGAIAVASASVHWWEFFWPSHFNLNERASRSWRYSAEGEETDPIVLGYIKEALPVVAMERWGVLGRKVGESLREPGGVHDGRKWEDRRVARVGFKRDAAQG